MASLLQDAGGTPAITGDTDAEVNGRHTRQTVLQPRAQMLTRLLVHRRACAYLCGDRRHY